MAVVVVAAAAAAVALLSCIPTARGQDWLKPIEERARIHQPGPADDPLGAKRRRTKREMAEERAAQIREANKVKAAAAAVEAAAAEEAAGHAAKEDVAALDPNVMRSKRVRSREGKGERRAAIKVMRSGSDGAYGGAHQGRPPPCAAEMDTLCAKQRDMGADYEEMQQVSE